MIPTAAERLVWGQGDGSTMPVFDTSVGKIGAVICWENYMPLLRVTMYSKSKERLNKKSRKKNINELITFPFLNYRHSNLLCSNSRFKRRMDLYDAPHCIGRKMLCLGLQSVQS